MNSSHIRGVYPSEPNPTSTPWRNISSRAGHAHRVVAIRLGVVHHVDLAPGQSRNVRGAHVHAMRSERPVIENAQVPQAHDRRLVVAPAGVIKSQRSSATWTWKPARSDSFASTARRSVRSLSVKEACSPKLPATRPSPEPLPVAFEKTDVLSDALRRARAAIAVGSLVAQNPAQADFAKSLLDPVQASRASVGAGVVIHQRAHSTLGGVNQAHQRAVVNIVQI